MTSSGRSHWASRAAGRGGGVANGGSSAASAAAQGEWLRPELVIRAEFAGWTGDGLVRQASYKGIELEKDPRKVIRELPKA